MHVINGIREILAVMVSGLPEGFVTDAEPCIEKEQAMAAAEMLGDGALKPT